MFHDESYWETFSALTQQYWLHSPWPGPPHLSADQAWYQTTDSCQCLGTEMMRRRSILFCSSCSDTRWSGDKLWRTLIQRRLSCSPCRCSACTLTCWCSHMLKQYRGIIWNRPPLLIQKEPATIMYEMKWSWDIIFFFVKFLMINHFYQYPLIKAKI